MLEHQQPLLPVGLARHRDERGREPVDLKLAHELRSVPYGTVLGLCGLAVGVGVFVHGDGHLSPSPFHQFVAFQTHF